MFEAPAHDRYEIRRQLGTGGMGIVYEAFDRERELLVALKTMHATSAQGAAQLKNEFRGLADVVHPNLVGLYELIVEGDQIFFTMELIRGVTLLEWIWRRGVEEPRTERAGVPDRSSIQTMTTASLDIGAGTRAIPGRVSRPPDVDYERLRDAARQLVLGITAIHDAGKLHRDLKPSNVLVDDDGRIVILDFGLVENALPGGRAITSQEDRRISGTPPYISPEQCTGHRATPASDWYAFGAILYKALTGRAPFLGSDRDIIFDKLRFEPPAPRTISSDVPDDLDGLVTELLRMDPIHRPVAAEIAQRLAVDKEALREAGAPLAPPMNIIGRDHELEILAQALADVRGGRRRLVRINGASGYGKTALVDGFLDDVVEEDCLVLRGRCYERESLPYKAMDPIMEQLGQVLARADAELVSALATDDTALASRVFPSLHRLDSARADSGEAGGEISFELRRRAFAAVRRLFERLARDRVVVIVIDDLQWGDADSWPLIDELVAHPRAPALLFIVGYRTEGHESNPLVARVAEYDATDIFVGPLDESKGRELACSLLRAAGLTSERSEAIATEASGHPFFIYELARYAIAHDVELESGTSLEQLIGRRVRHLPEAARRFATTTAIAGSPTPIAVVAAAARIEGGDLMKTVNLLRSRQMIRTSGVRRDDTVEPYHDRVGETLVAMVDAQSAQQQHLALADAILDSGRADAEGLARHFLGAGDHRRGTHYSLEAAVNAERAMAFERAADLYQQALAHGQLNDGRRSDVYERMGAALGNAGLGTRAAAAYLAATDAADGARELELRRLAALQNLCSGHLSEGMELLRGVLADIGLSIAVSPRRALLRLVWLRLRLRLRGLSLRRRAPSDISQAELVRADICRTVGHAIGLYDIVRASEFHTRGVLVAQDTGDPGRFVLAMALQIFMEATGGRRASRRTRRALREMEHQIEEMDDQLIEAWRHAARTGIDFAHGEFEAALAGSERSLAAMSSLPGVDYEVTTIALFGLWSLYFLGRWRGLDERLRARVGAARQRGDLYTEVNLRTGVLNAVWLMRDQPQRAREDLADAMRPWPERRFHLQHYWQILAECQTFLYEGDAERAWHRIDRGWGPFVRSMFMRLEVIRIEAVHARARAAVALARVSPDGRKRATLLRAARRAARRLGRERAPWARALSLLVRGSVAHVEGDLSEAVRLLGEGSAACGEHGLCGFATAARIQLDAWTETGDQSASESFANEGVVAPARMARMLVP